ncbi:unnamed protein product, partial [marine sediment metagenome]
MKRLATALAVCALLIPAANAFGGDFTWNGEKSDVWTYHKNWTGPAGEYPDDAGDDVTINDLDWLPTGTKYVPNVNAAVTIRDLTMIGNATGNAYHAKLSFNSANDLTVTGMTELSDDVDLLQVYPNTGILIVGVIEVKAVATVLNNVPDVEASSLRIDADDAGGDRLFEKAGTGAMSVSGSVILYGDDESAGRATFQYTDQFTDDSFSASHFDMDGRGYDGGEAVLDIDATLDMSPSTDIAAEGYCEIDVENGDTFTVRAVTVDATAGRAQISQVTGTGKVEATSLTITAGDSEAEPPEDAVYLLSAGTLDVNGKVELYGPTG